MIGRALLAIPAMLVPSAAPAEQPLKVVSVDASAYPEVLIEVVVPPQYTGDAITAQMVEVDGATVASVTPVDPASVIVGLVIDDGPAVAPSVVTALQGGAVELVLNTRSGIRIALRTPSGLQSALTADRGANIARIAGIIAGAPAVVPLPEVVLDAVAALVTDPAGDRQAVVVLGGPFEATDAQVNDLASLVADSGTTLHLVTPAGVEAPALARIVEKSGGVIAASRVLLASIDRVTAVISNRYLISATLADAGAHRVGLTVDGELFAAEIDVPAPRSQPTSPPTTRPTPTTSPTTSPTTARTVPSSSVAAAPPATGAPASAEPAGEQRAGSSIAATVLLLVAVAVVGAAVLMFVRRWRGKAPRIMSTEADQHEAARSSMGRLLLTVAAAAFVGGLGWLIAYALDAFDPEGATSTGFPLAGDDDESLRRPTTSRPEVSASLATTSPTATSTTTVATATTTTPTTTTPTTTTTTTTMTTPQPQPSPVPTSTEVVPATLSALPTYSTLPDGSPVPVLATFDVDTITLSGAVPSQAAADRLAALALANSKTPATVVSSLTIDPAVPLNVGVRVLELTSTRFPPGSAEILPTHALEFDRVAAVMNALPNVTVLVVGHADRGSDASNFELSTARAQSVVDYLVALGVSPSRLSWRAVGESDLVSLANDETALALNRRTEFILYGLLLGG